MELKTKLHSDNEIVIVEIIGELNTLSVQNFKDTLFDLIEKGPSNILLNCEKLTYINSAGLGAIAGVFKKIKEKQGQLKVIHVSGPIMEVFEMIRFTKLIPVYESENLALESFKR